MSRDLVAASPFEQGPAEPFRKTQRPALMAKVPQLPNSQKPGTDSTAMHCRQAPSIVWNDRQRAPDSQFALTADEKKSSPSISRLVRRFVRFQGNFSHVRLAKSFRYMGHGLTNYRHVALAAIGFTPTNAKSSSFGMSYWATAGTQELGAFLGPNGLTFSTDESCRSGNVSSSMADHKVLFWDVKPGASRLWSLNEDNQLLYRSRRDHFSKRQATGGLSSDDFGAGIWGQAAPGKARIALQRMIFFSPDSRTLVALAD